MRIRASLRHLARLAVVSVLVFVPAEAQGQAPLRIFISVDMEGIGGIGTSAMTNSAGKDYATGRQLMTLEVNAVVAAILERGPAEILVNDSHGDHQNVLHTELDPRVVYTQGGVKPYGMVEGLDESFDGVIFLGYHARAGEPDGFLAHTGSGIVKGLWINDMESGEGEMNAAFAGAHGVPILLAAGDSIFVEQFSRNVKTTTVSTKTAVTPQAARLKSPDTVRRELAAAVGRALDARASAQPLAVTEPVRVRMRFDDTTRPQILEAIPGVTRSDGYTVDFTMPTMKEAYRMIRFMYRFVAT